MLKKLLSSLNYLCDDYKKLNYMKNIEKFFEITIC